MGDATATAKKATPAGQGVEHRKGSPSAEIYAEPYTGERPWFLAIQPREEEGSLRKAKAKLFPAFSVDVGGLTFQARTQEVIEEEDEEDEEQLVLSLGGKRPGAYARLTHAQIQAFLASVAIFFVRWSGWDKKKNRFSRAQVLCLNARHVQVNEHSGAVTVGQQVYLPQAGDEPLSRYLVLLPVGALKTNGGRANAAEMPSVEDLEPSSVHPLVANCGERSSTGSAMTEAEAEAEALSEAG